MNIIKMRRCFMIPAKSANFNKRLYSIKELVREIGCTEWYWRSQIWDGRLPYVQVGRKMLVDREDIESFIKVNKMQN
jgi:excisionase family DNA binding protein